MDFQVLQPTSKIGFIKSELPVRPGVATQIFRKIFQKKIAFNQNQTPFLSVTHPILRVSQRTRLYVSLKRTRMC